MRYLHMHSGLQTTNEAVLTVTLMRHAVVTEHVSSYLSRYRCTRVCVCVIWFISHISLKDSVPNWSPVLYKLSVKMPYLKLAVCSTLMLLRMHTVLHMDTVLVHFGMLYTAAHNLSRAAKRIYSLRTARPTLALHTPKFPNPVVMSVLVSPGEPQFHPCGKQPHARDSHGSSSASFSCAWLCAAQQPVLCS